MTGIVFDIQRFALHDGPGIRTTVFLKGCPLQCLWCHNPESQAFAPQLSHNPERCGTCPACLEAKERGVASLKPAAAYVEACPNGAFTLIGEPMTVERVMDEVMRDEAYYRRSGGGLTLSGGEPLAQFDFALALLKAAKERGLHTCLDTSGAVSERKIAEVAEFVDLFLFDYKATDPAEHQRLTGASNARILANLDFLYRRGARIRLRCPLIPSVNDTPEHLGGIAALSARYPDLESVEVMAYHDLGKDKAARVGMTYPLPHVPTADEATQAAWLGMLGTLGCTRARLG